MDTVSKKPEKKQLLVYFSTMLVALSASFLGVFALLESSSPELSKWITIIEKVFGYSISLLFISISFQFYKKNTVSFVVLVLLGLLFFVATTSSILSR